MPRIKSVTLNLRIDPELKAAAEKAAAADRRSLTSLVEKLLEGYLRDRGFLGRPPTQVAQASGAGRPEDEASMGLKLPRGEG